MGLDDEFFLGRILLLITYAKVDISDLAVNLNDVLPQVLISYRQSSGTLPGTECEVIEELALTETLKLMYNVSHLTQIIRTVGGVFVLQVLLEF